MPDSKSIQYAKLKIGQEFKNYKSLCDFLNTSSTGGKTKKYKIEEFKRHFSWHNDGYKFIIDNVYDAEITKDISSRWKNNKNVQPMIIYFLNHFSDLYLDEYYTYSSVYSKLLKIFNNKYYKSFIEYSQLENEVDKAIYKSVYDVKFEEKEYKIVKLYIPFVRHILQDLLQKTLRFLVRENIASVEEGYSFVYHAKQYILSIGTSELNEYIEQMETSICKELLENDERFEKYKNVVKGNGRQLKYFLHSQNQGELLSIYNQARMDYIYNKENKTADGEDALLVLNAAIESYTFDHPIGISNDGKEIIGKIRTIGDKPGNKLDDYYKAFKVNSMDYELYEYPKENNIQDVLEIVIKLAAKMVLNHKETREECSKFGGIYYQKYEPYKSNETIKLLNRVNKQLFCTVPIYIIPDLSKEDFSEQQLMEQREQRVDNYVREFYARPTQKTLLDFANEVIDEKQERIAAQIADYERGVDDWDYFIDSMMMR